jgi:hypothetical protein
MWASLFIFERDYMEAEWLTEVIRFIVVGQVYPGWLLKKPLRGVVEQDRMGHYLIRRAFGN